MAIDVLGAAVTLSAVLLGGLFSRSFREAQSYCGPLMLVGVEFNASHALVPLFRHGLRWQAKRDTAFGRARGF